MAKNKFIKVAVVSILSASAGWILLELARKNILNLSLKLGLSGDWGLIIIFLLIIAILIGLGFNWEKIFGGK